LNSLVNRQWRLASRPSGQVSEENFRFVEEAVVGPSAGEALVRVKFVAFEPAMRGWLDDVKSYAPPVQIDEVMRASGVGEVIESNIDGVAVGDWVLGNFGWQEYVIVSAETHARTPLRRVPDGVAPQLMLSALGTTGLTAYFGMLEIGKPTAGDHVLITGAAGATGSIAGQIAKLKGAEKVIGIAGGPEKCSVLVEQLGFDVAIDYKSERVRRRLREECPNGVNVFFDNVGGQLLDDGLINMARNGRIVICGGISSYNDESVPPGPKYYMQLVARHLTMEGFLLFDYADKNEQALKDLGEWVQQGKIVHLEDIQSKIENAPKTFLRLFEGKNVGKQLLEI